MFLNINWDIILPQQIGSRKVRECICIRSQTMVTQPLRQAIGSWILSDLRNQLITLIVRGGDSTLINFAKSVSRWNVSNSNWTLSTKHIHVGVRHLKALWWDVHWRSLKCGRRISLNAVSKLICFNGNFKLVPWIIKICTQKIYLIHANCYSNAFKV